MELIELDLKEKQMSLKLMTQILPEKGELGWSPI